MAKKKPAKPAKKSAQKTTARKPERSKGELSSEDLDSVAGGIIIINSAPISAIKDAIKQVEKIAPSGLGSSPSITKLEP